MIKYALINIQVCNAIHVRFFIRNFVMGPSSRFFVGNSMWVLVYVSLSVGIYVPFYGVLIIKSIKLSKSTIRSLKKKSPKVLFATCRFKRCILKNGGRCGRDRRVVGNLIAKHHWNLCNQCLSPLKLCVLDTTLCDKIVTCARSVVFCGYSFPPPYTWDIVETGVKHPNHNLTLYTQICNPE